MNNEEKEYIKLTPFKMQVLQSFPFIDADFDALTNYELLCKVVDYLNKTIDNVDVLHDEVEEYINKFNQLKNYVDNYFDNLDVQEEINNKLDEMAESGVLTGLIKDYVDPIYQAYEEEINQDIEDFKNEVNSDISDQNTEIFNFKTLINNQVQHIDEKVTNATSGSPKGVYPTVQDLINADPDHDYIYVVSADGNWYYYDSSLGTWTSGGVYQATEDSQTVTDLSNLINVNNLNLYKKSDCQNGYINTADGTIVSSNIFTYAKILVEPETTYYLYRKSQLYKHGDNCSFFNDNTLLSYVDSNNNYATLGEYNCLKLTTPANCNYLAFNVKISVFGYDETDTLVLSKALSINSLLGNDNLLRSYLETYKNSFINLYNNEKLTYAYKYLSSSGILTSQNPSQYVEIPVEEEKTYYLYRESENYNLNGDRIYFKEIGSDQISHQTTLTSLKTTLFGKTILKITIPSNCNKLLFNDCIYGSYNDINKTILTEYETIQCLIGTDLELRENLSSYIQKFISNLIGNDFNNKKWLIFGDSLSMNGGAVTKKYYDYIKDKTNINFTNHAVSGMGYVAKVNSKNISDTIDDVSSSVQYDYITIFAGTNDINQTLGSITDTQPTSVYGSIRHSIETLITKFPNAKIGLITPLPRAGAFGDYYGTSNNNKLYQIVKAIQEVASDYSIPVFEVYTKSNFRPWNSTNNDTYFLHTQQNPNGDGLHLNETGHEVFSVKVLNWMQSI